MGQPSHRPHLEDAGGQALLSEVGSLKELRVRQRVLNAKHTKGAHVVKGHVGNAQVLSQVRCSGDMQGRVIKGSGRCQVTRPKCGEQRELRCKSRGKDAHEKAKKSATMRSGFWCLISSSSSWCSCS